MNWIEIIVIRSMSLDHEPAVRKLVDLFNENIGSRWNTRAALYKNAFISTDLAVHIIWRESAIQPSKSDPGIQLATAMEGFGRIHHTVWAPEYTSS